MGKSRLKKRVLLQYLCFVSVGEYVKRKVPDEL